MLKDAAKGIVRQFGSVVKDETKVELLKSREHKPDGGTWQACNEYRSQFTTAPIGKLVLLCVVKFAMLDPAGMGVEMEAGKPGWNDAMNGLPGMIGSGMPETFELLRLLRYTRGAITRAARSVELWSELDALLSAALGRSARRSATTTATTATTARSRTRPSSTGTRRARRSRSTAQRRASTA